MVKRLAATVNVRQIAAEVAEEIIVEVENNLAHYAEHMNEENLIEAVFCKVVDEDYPLDDLLARVMQEPAVNEALEEAKERIKEYIKDAKAWGDGSAAAQMRYYGMNMRDFL